MRKLIRIVVILILTGFIPALSLSQSVTHRQAEAHTCNITPSSVEAGDDTPQQTEGPYFVDTILKRSDIRSDPTNHLVQQGIPLQLVFHIYKVKPNGSCVPLKRARVDIWNANSQGVYSDVKAAGTAGKYFLRGYQITNRKGVVQFTTIYPGWYATRAIHIHIKVRAFTGSKQTLEWTSQFYFDDAVNNDVHTQPPYSQHGPVKWTNEEDYIYNGASTDGLFKKDTGKHLMLNLVKNRKGYLGTFNVVIDTKQSE